MEKLLQLLNEYRPLETDMKYYIADWDVYIKENTVVSNNFTPRVISEKFWFIEWLVAGGMIDYAKVEDICCRDVDLYFKNRDFYGKYKRLLMLISIQDDPIRFLVSILK